MPITRNFKETIQARAIRDEAFRENILRESIECMLTGDVHTGKALLRDYINATIGFKKLSKLTDKNPKSLMRMFSETGNPTANNLFDILHVLQEKDGVQYEVHILKLKSNLSRREQRINFKKEKLLSITV